MAKSPVSKPKAAPSRSKPMKPAKPPRDPEASARLRRVVLHSLSVFICLIAAAVGVRLMKRHVEQDLAFPSQPPKVVLKDRPVWMTDLLAEQIIRSVRPAGAHSAFDHQLLVDVGQMLATNPWIRQVKQVRRAYDQQPGDTIEIDCDYRAPIALVHWRDYYWLVDGDGVKLPEQFTAQQLPRIVIGQNRKMNIRIIEGVHNPPVESGRKWPGDDLAAGLDLVKVLYGQSYAEEIVSVDVSNFNGRVDQREAQLVLGTRYETQIRWGQPVATRGFEVPTALKLRRLKDVCAEYGRVDGHRPWIDIRFDKITYPVPPSEPATASGR
jgi:hypothetical protein